MIRLITENFGLKLLSLVVAVLLYLATVGEGQITTAVAVPVQYRSIPPSMEIGSELVDSAYIELRGSAERLSGGSLANAVVILDLSEQIRAGERTYSITSDNVKLPPGVAFLRAIPSQIRLRLEPRVSRELPVVVRYSNRMPDGYSIKSQQVEPSTVKVVGPEGRVNALDRVQTDPIDLTASEGEMTYRVHPFAGDPMVRLDRSDLLITVKVLLEKSR
jgi:YbbR domain-containing protein